MCLIWKCRVTGVTDQCDHPKEASSRHKVVRCSADCTGGGCAEGGGPPLGPREGGPPRLSVDAELLAREGPGLVLAQDVSRSGSADGQAVAEVGRP